VELSLGAGRIAVAASIVSPARRWMSADIQCSSPAMLAACASPSSSNAAR
jgi:hypothetical protein